MASGVISTTPFHRLGQKTAEYDRICQSLAIDAHNRGKDFCEELCHRYPSGGSSRAANSPANFMHQLKVGPAHCRYQLLRKASSGDTTGSVVRRHHHLRSSAPSLARAVAKELSRSFQSTAPFERSTLGGEGGTPGAFVRIAGIFLRRMLRELSVNGEIPSHSAPLLDC